MNKWRHLLEPLIQKSLVPVTWEQALAQDYVLFESEHSVLVANEGAVNGKKALQIWLAAGEMEDVDNLYMHLEDYAKSNGYGAITYVGRKGWLRTHGFTEHSVVGVKEI